MSEIEISQQIDGQEFLYRGIVENNWDYTRNRISSAAFKDSKGVSVDRDAFRDKEECIKALNKKKNFFGICRVKTQIVRELNAIVKYLPEKDNIYHSEIHDSITDIPMKGSKPRRIREMSELVYKKL